MPERGGGLLDRFHVGQPDPSRRRRGSARGQQCVKPLGIQRVDSYAKDDPGHDPRKVAPPHPIHRPSLAHIWPLHANRARIETEQDRWDSQARCDASDDRDITEPPFTAFNAGNTVLIQLEQVTELLLSQPGVTADSPE
jgi:hypothetical protein